MAPFLARLGDKAELTGEEKARVRDECLQDTRTRLVEVANIIQLHFEKVNKQKPCGMVAMITVLAMVMVVSMVTGE